MPLTQTIIHSLNKHTLTVLSLSLFLFSFSTHLLAVSEQKALQNNPINLLEEKQKLEEMAIENLTIDKNTSSGEASESEEPIDSFESLYKVELLVFAYVNTGEENSEVWRNPPRPSFEAFQTPLSKEELPLSLNKSEKNVAAENPPLQKNKYLFLNPEEKGVSDFSDIMRKMKINGHYRTLQHKIWQQKVLDESAQDLFFLEGGERFISFEEAKTLEPTQKDLPVVKLNPLNGQQIAVQSNDEQDKLKQSESGQSELIGTLHIYRSRYLHIRTNLWLSEFAENDAGLCLEDAPSLPSFEEQPASQQNIKSYTNLTNFQLKQHRRMRSSELHYLDHPRFGLLIKFTRVEKPEEKPLGD